MAHFGNIFLCSYVSAHPPLPLPHLAFVVDSVTITPEAIEVLANGDDEIEGVVNDGQQARLENDTAAEGHTTVLKRKRVAVRILSNAHRYPYVNLKEDLTHKLIY